ncbi:MAG: hypothetical protein IJJ33_09900 [Victivallales bacterium]|nr:hypothetical protein [Victivallales bacterium]
MLAQGWGATIVDGVLDETDCSLVTSSAAADDAASSEKSLQCVDDEFNAALFTGTASKLTLESFFCGILLLSSGQNIFCSIFYHASVYWMLMFATLSFVEGRQMKENVLISESFARRCEWRHRALRLCRRDTTR